MSKDAWFAEYERQLARLEDAGRSDAFEEASELAYDKLRETLEDRVDIEKKRRRGE